MSEINCAYILTHVPSGKFYVGSTSNPKRRLKEHLTLLKRRDHHCRELQRLYNELPSVKITEWFLSDTREDAYDLEQGLLDARQDDPNLLNVGKNAKRPWLGVNHTEETKQKIGISQRGSLNHSFGKSLSKEHRDKISQANNGYKHTQEAKSRISISKLGKSLSVEHRSKLSRLKQGTVHTPESRAKMSEKKKGRLLSPEHIEKIKLANLKRTYFGPSKISVDETVYSSLAEGARALNISVVMLRNRINSDHPKYAGYFRISG